MDIERWLNETAEAGIPPKQGQASDSAFFQPTEIPRAVFKDKHARKRARSDSSLLAPQTYLPRVSPVKTKPTPEKQVDTSAHSDASRPSRSDSTGSESSSHRYARRPRRKTRPELYEPKRNKERGKHVHQSRKDESKNPRRKSKRKKGDKSDSGVAQNFHAKNVSRDRLTLKPKDHLGIFNKGKTSTAVRGRGLPDLVFSEMKFLQKEKDQPESTPEQGTSKKKRKKDHVQTKEGEISAFFTSVQPALAEKDNNVPTKQARAVEDLITAIRHHEPEQSSKSSGVVPTIEIPGKGSYLGFGSRGPRHESTSYVSWPESVRSPDLTPRRPKHPPVENHDPHQVSNHRQLGINLSGRGDCRLKVPVPPIPRKQRSNESTERFQMSSVALSQNRMSRSHSYPQHTSSPRKLDLVDRAAKFQSTESVGSPSSMPPFVSKPARVDVEYRESGVSAKSATRQKATHSATHNTVVNSHRPEGHMDDVRETSSDLGRAIQHCNRTYSAQRCATEPHRSHREVDAPYISNKVTRVAPVAMAKTHRRPTVRFQEIEAPAPRAPNFSGCSIYQQQAERMHFPGAIVEEEFSDFNSPEEELMHSQANAPDWYDEVEGPPSYGRDYEATDPGLGALGTMVGSVQRISTDNTVVAPGFWRPNRLY
ncbi:hypothetical protein HBI25_117060 [Parastagonospora nodorum]|nr:hypothetical protein HBH61_182420 [Parastagonospora nodorum]KAH4935229.1 hypothetical protein HBI79_082920 [Parastagonospora nodorum]KAH4993773.1 hypothetical protein HBI76_026730 [Parastagonospora nodorum]KAH5203435.1 hypothetical protein HBH68_107780 [Parastagonospora nodorum]KAH5287250.1 hypothetical protein HBI70_016970 [Parastagonospora nodorum]